MILLVVAAVIGLVAGWPSARLIRAETGSPIPVGIPAAITAILCAAVAWRFGLAWDLPAYAYFAMLSVPLTIIDVRTYRLPNNLTLSAYPIVLLGLMIPAAIFGDWSAFGRALLAGAALLGLFLILHVINPSGMGLGDVKLAAPMGVLLGWIGWSTAIAGAFIAFLTAALVGLMLMAFGKAGRKSALPFGPFMLAGAWVAILAS